MKWLAALCLMLAALLLGYRSMQDSALNHQLYERQRELGYPSKKKPFWIGKRIASLLLVSAAVMIMLPVDLLTVKKDSDPKPLAVMQETTPEAKTREILIEDSSESPTITLNSRIQLIEEEIAITDQRLLGFYEEQGRSYNVYVIENELIFQDQDGNTYRNVAKGL